MTKTIREKECFLPGGGAEGLINILSVQLCQFARDSYEYDLKDVGHQ
jgi:hypothetical protein